MVKKYAIAQSNKEIVYNLTEERLHHFMVKRRRRDWFIATKQETNPPDIRSDIVLIHRIAKKIRRSKDKIGINKVGAMARWVSLF